MTAILF